MMKWLHQMGSFPWFYRFSGRVLPWLIGSFLLLTAYGLYGGLVLAPQDYQQGDAFRIIYVHVPAAWMSLFIYMVMAAYSLIVLVWRIKLTEVLLVSSLPVGAGFTFITLVTGAIWGKPMWGTWWSWDARLTSELLLLFLYIGMMGLYSSIEDKRTASKATAILCLIGVVNIPIIHFSVEWWNTLHQGSTLSLTDKPSIHIDMLIPLLVMAVSFKLFYFASLFIRARAEMVEREGGSQWLAKVIQEQS